MMCRVFHIMILACCGSSHGEGSVGGGESPAEHSLENLCFPHARICSGSEPRSDRDFAYLQSIGISAVVSVDGAIPMVDTAARRGIRYLHIPIGYDGIPEDSALLLASVYQDLSGKIYIHCHHGKHRGPAAAAAMLTSAGEFDRLRALDFLNSAGTSHQYSGLYLAVENSSFIGRDKLKGISLPRPVVDPGGMARQMANIDRFWDGLKEVKNRHRLQDIHHPDLAPSHKAILLEEALVEFHRLPRPGSLTPDKNELFAQFAVESIEAVRKLRVLLSDPSPLHIDRANEEFFRIQKSCSDCHKNFR